MAKIDQTVLDNFRTTIMAHPDANDKALFKVFPQFDNDTILLNEAKRYVDVSNSGEYTLEELNKQFPAFFNEDTEVEQKSNFALPTAEEVADIKPTSYEEMLDKMDKAFLTTEEGKKLYDAFNSEVEAIYRNYNNRMHATPEWRDLIFWYQTEINGDSRSDPEFVGRLDKEYEKRYKELFDKTYKQIVDRKVNKAAEKYKSARSNYYEQNYMQNLYDLYLQGVDISESGVDFEKFPMIGNQELHKKRTLALAKKEAVYKTLTEEEKRAYNGEVWHDSRNVPIEGKQESDASFINRTYGDSARKKMAAIDKEFNEINTEWLKEYAKAQYDPIKKKIDATTKLYDEYSSKASELLNEGGASESMALLGAGRLTTAKKPKAGHEKEYNEAALMRDQLYTIKSLYEDALKEADKPYHATDKSFWDRMKNYWSALTRGAKDTASDPNTWLWNIPEVAKYKNIIEPILIKNRYGSISKEYRKQYDALLSKSELTSEEQKTLDRIKSLIESSNSLSDTEIAVLDALMYKQTVQGLRAGTVSNFYTGMETGVNSIAFMLEFLVTGGLLEGAAKAATTSYAKHLMTKKMGKEVVEEMLKGSGRRHLTRLAGSVEKNTLIGSGARIAASIPQAFLMPSFYTGMINDMAFKLGQNEEGKYITEFGDSLGKAFAKNVTEVVSESFGTVFDKIPRLFSPRLFNKFDKTEISKWGKILYGANATMRRAGVNSIPGEILEEISGNVMNMGFAKMSNDNEWLEDTKSFWTLDNFGSMLVGFSMLPVFGTVKTAYDYKKAKFNAAHAEADLRKVLVSNGVEPAAIEELIGKVQGAEYVLDISKAMTDFARTHSFDIMTQAHMNAAVAKMLCNKAAYENFMDESFDMNGYITSNQQALDDFTMRENFRSVMNLRMDYLAFEDGDHIMRGTNAEGEEVYVKYIDETSGEYFVYNAKTKNNEVVPKDQFTLTAEFDLTPEMRNQIINEEVRKSGGYQAMLDKYAQEFAMERFFAEKAQSESAEDAYNAYVESEKQRKEEEKQEVKDKAEALLEEESKKEESAEEKTEEETEEVAPTEEAPAEEAAEGVEETVEDKEEEKTPEQIEEEYQQSVMDSAPKRNGRYDVANFSYTQQFIYTMQKYGLDVAVEDIIKEYKKIRDKKALNEAAKRDIFEEIRSLITKYSPENLVELEKLDNFADKKQLDNNGKNDLRTGTAPLRDDAEQTNVPGSDGGEVAGTVPSGENPNERDDGGNVPTGGVRSEQPESSEQNQQGTTQQGDGSGNTGVLAKPISPAAGRPGTGDAVLITNELKQENDEVDAALNSVGADVSQVHINQVTYEHFTERVNEQKQKNGLEESWNIYLPSKEYDGYDLTECECYASEDGRVGFAIHDGKLIAIYNFSLEENAYDKAVLLAIRMGAYRVECNTNNKAQNLYARFGGICVSATMFNVELPQNAEWRELGCEMAGRGLIRVPKRDSKGNLVLNSWGRSHQSPTFYISLPKFETAVSSYNKDAMAVVHNVKLFTGEDAIVNALAARDALSGDNYEEAVTQSKGRNNMVAVWKEAGNQSKTLLGVAVRSQEENEDGEYTYMLLTRWKQLREGYKDMTPEEQAAAKKERESLENQTEGFGNEIVIRGKSTKVAELPSDEILYAVVHRDSVNEYGEDIQEPEYVPVVMHHRESDEYMQTSRNTVAVVDAVTNRVFLVRLSDLYKKEGDKYETVVKSGKKNHGQRYADKITDEEGCLSRVVNDDLARNSTDINSVQVGFSGFSFLKLLFGTGYTAAGKLVEDKKKPRKDNLGRIIYKKDDDGNKIPLRDKNGKVKVGADGKVLYRPEYETYLSEPTKISPFVYFKNLFISSRPDMRPQELAKAAKDKINDRILEWNSVVSKFNISELFEKAKAGEYGERLQTSAKHLEEDNLVKVDGKEEQKGLPVQRYDALQIPLIGEYKESPEAKNSREERRKEKKAASHKAKDGDEYGIELARSIVAFVAEAQKAAGKNYFDFDEGVLFRRPAAEEQEEERKESSDSIEEQDEAQKRVAEINKKISDLEKEQEGDISDEEFDKIGDEIDALVEERNSLLGLNNDSTVEENNEEDNTPKQNDIEEDIQEPREEKGSNTEDGVKEKLEEIIEEPAASTGFTIDDFITLATESNVPDAMVSAQNIGEGLISKVGQRDRKGSYLMTASEMAAELIKNGVSAKDTQAVVAVLFNGNMQLAERVTEKAIGVLPLAIDTSHIASEDKAIQEEEKPEAKLKAKEKAKESKPKAKAKAEEPKAKTTKKSTAKAKGKTKEKAASVVKKSKELQSLKNESAALLAERDQIIEGSRDKKGKDAVKEAEKAEQIYDKLKENNQKMEQLHAELLSLVSEPQAAEVQQEDEVAETPAASNLEVKPNQIESNTKLLSKDEIQAEISRLSDEWSLLDDKVDVGIISESEYEERKAELTQQINEQQALLKAAEERENGGEDFMVQSSPIETDEPATQRVVGMLRAAGVNVRAIDRSEVRYFVSQEGWARLENSTGKLYGFADSKGNVYLIKEEFNPNTPIHEYTHLWFNALKQSNKKLAQSIISTLKRHELWQQVASSEEYGKHWQQKNGWSEYDVDCKIAGEVLSILTDNAGSEKDKDGRMRIERMYDEAQRSEKPILAAIKASVNKFMHWVTKFLIENVHLRSKRIDKLLFRSVMNMPLTALARGVNPKIGEINTLYDGQLSRYDARLKELQELAKAGAIAADESEVDGEKRVITTEDIRDLEDSLMNDIRRGRRPAAMANIPLEALKQLLEEKNNNLRKALVIASIFSYRSEQTNNLDEVHPGYNDKEGYQDALNDESATAMEYLLEQILDKFGLFYTSTTEMFGEELGAGTESVVYKKGDESNVVTKVQNIFLYKNALDFLESIVLGNYYFPQTERTLIGFGLRRDGGYYENDEVFCAIYEQPFIVHSSVVTEVTDADIDNFMLSKGFERLPDSVVVDENNIARSYSNGIVRITDIHNDNVMYNLVGGQLEPCLIDGNFYMESPFRLIDKDDAEEFMVAGGTPSQIDAYVDEKAKESNEEWLKRKVGTNEDLKKLLEDLPRDATRLFDNNLPVKYLVDQINAFRAGRGLGPINETTHDIYNILNRVAPSIQSKKTLFNQTIAKEMYDTIDEAIKQMGKDGVLEDARGNGVVYDAFDMLEMYLMACDNKERALTADNARYGEFVSVVGMTPSEYIEKIENIVDVDLLDKLHRKVKAVSDYSIDILFDAGMIDKWKYKSMKKRKFYVPQKGFHEADIKEAEVEEVRAKFFYGHKAGVVATAMSHTAKGGDSMAAGPLAYLMYDVYDAIAKVERNNAKRVMWDILSENQEFCKKYGFDEMTPIWFERDLDAIRDAKENLDILKEKKRIQEASGAPSADILQTENEILEATEELVRVKSERSKKTTTKPVAKLVADEATHQLIDTLEDALYHAIEMDDIDTVNDIRKKIEDLEDSLYITRGEIEVKSDQAIESKSSDYRVQLFVDGVLQEMRFPSATIADAVNGNFNTNGRAHGFYTKFTTAMAAIYTTYNPFFWMSNMQKDIPVIAARGTQEYGPEFIGAFTRELKKKTKIFDYSNGKLDTSTPEGKLLERFLIGGGNTGFNEQKELEALRASVRKAVRGGRRNILIDNRVAAGCEAINQWSELKTRFAAYCAVLDLGYSENEALKAAKNLSVNFNRRGAGSPIFNFFNSISLFSNANIQGALNALEFLKKAKDIPAWIDDDSRLGKKLSGRTKRVAQTTAQILDGGVKVLATIALMGFMNVWLNPDDDDDEKQFSDYLRENYILLGDYIKIPVGEDLRPFWNVGVQIGLMTFCNKQWSDAALSIWSVGLQTLLPIPTNPKDAGVYLFDTAVGRKDQTDGTLPTALMIAFTPSAMSGIRNAAENKNFMGKKLRKEYDDYAQYTLAPNALQMSQDISEWLFVMGGGDLNTGKTTKADGKKINPRFDQNPKQIESVMSTLIASDWMSILNLAWTGVHQAVEGESYLTPYQLPIIKRNIHVQDPETYRYNTYLELKSKTGVNTRTKQLTEAIATQTAILQKDHNPEKVLEESRRIIEENMKEMEDNINSPIYKLLPEISAALIEYNVNSPIYMMYRTGNLTRDIDKFYSKEEQKQMEAARQDAVVRMRALLYQIELIEKQQKDN